MAYLKWKYGVDKKCGWVVLMDGWCIQGGNKVFAMYVPPPTTPPPIQGGIMVLYNIS